MSKKNLDQKILLFVLSDEELGISATDINDILDKFSNYSHGYVYDRLSVLRKEGLLAYAEIPRTYLYLTEKGKEVAIKLKEER